MRPVMFLEDVSDARLEALKLPHAATVPAIVLKNDNGFVLRDSVVLTDVARGA